MAEQFYTILTQVGKAKIANATALGTKVNFKEMAVGDGKGNYYNPTENQTELVNEVWRGQINHVEVDNTNPNWIKISIVIPSTIGGFTIREAGIFDDKGNMIAIGKYPETYKPILDDGSSKDLLINMILEVSNTSSVTLKVDPTVILATKKDIEILNNKIENIEVPVTKVNDKTGDVVLSAADIKTSSGETIETQLADMTQQIENIDLSADKVTVNNSNLNSKDVNSALTELFTFADNGKKNWVDVVGSPLLNTDSFSTLKSKTQTLKNTMASNLSSKGQSASGTESLNNLINKIKSIDTGLKMAKGTLETNVSSFEIRNLSFRPKYIFIINNVRGDYDIMTHYYVENVFNQAVKDGSPGTITENIFDIYNDGFKNKGKYITHGVGAMWITFG